MTEGGQYAKGKFEAWREGPGFGSVSNYRAKRIEGTGTDPSQRREAPAHSKTRKHIQDSR